MSSNWEKITGSQLLKTGVGEVSGVIVNSHSSGTIKLWDNTEASGRVILNEFTFATGSQVVTFPKPLNFVNGLYATLGGTADVTVVFN